MAGTAQLSFFFASFSARPPLDTLRQRAIDVAQAAAEKTRSILDTAFKVLRNSLQLPLFSEKRTRRAPVRLPKTEWREQRKEPLKSIGGTAWKGDNLLQQLQE